VHGARRRAEEVGTVVVDVARHASVERAVGRRLVETGLERESHLAGRPRRAGF
jgi:formate dehydrogenase assembly factor FdhD